MTETQAPPPQQWLDLLPAWVAVATLLCLPVTVYGLWRIAARVRAGGGLPLPDGRAFPASRIPMPFGLLLFGAMYLTTVLIGLVYANLAAIDPYFISLTELRERLATVLKAYFGVARS